MMRLRALVTSGAGLALLAATPALAAQDAPPIEEAAADETALSSAEAELAAMTQMFSGLFTTEPLTPEQEARVPAAEQLVAKVIPEGTMTEMMDKVFESRLGPMMAMAPGGATAILAEQIGTPAYALDIDEEQASQLVNLFDPAWQERQQRQMGMLPELMKEIVTLMEPGMRKAMSELYAIRFSAGELAEIEAFFSTGTGGRYARESFLMASDPRIMASTMEAMPGLIGVMGDLERRMVESTAGLPAMRSFSDLSAEERAKVAAMTGYSVEEIEANIESQSITIPPPPEPE